MAHNLTIARCISPVLHYLSTALELHPLWPLDFVDALNKGHQAIEIVVSLLCQLKATMQQPWCRTLTAFHRAPDDRHLLDDRGRNISGQPGPTHTH